MNNKTKKILKDKKGIEKIMSIWWISAWIFITVGIVLMVSAMNSKIVDVRDIHTEIIANKISSCSPEFFLSLSDKNQDFSDDCFPRKKIPEGFAVEIKVQRLNEQEPNSYFLRKGNSEILKQCDFSKVLDQTPHYAVCSEKFFVFEYDNSLYRVLITVASNEKGGRV